MVIMKILISNFLGFLFLLSSSLTAITPEQLQEYATKNNDSEFIEILMKYGDSKDNPILNRAMGAKDYFAISLLLAYGVEINSREGIAPYPRNGNGASPPYEEFRLSSNGRNNTVLEIAVAEGETALVEYFLLNGADPTVPFQVTAYKSNPPYVERWTEQYITTAVHDAIFYNRLDVLILFDQNRVDLNKICYEKQDSRNSFRYKKTPLQVAIDYKKKDIVAFLLSIRVQI